LVREAALTAMRESLEASEVTQAHLAKAREKVRPSLDAVQLTSLEAYAAARQVRITYVDALNGGAEVRSNLVVSNMTVLTWATD
jgi:hypothetical protein